MSEVAGSGRTVLFVSHNFAAVRALTKRAIVLQAGQLAFDGPVEAGLGFYTASLAKGGHVRNWGRGKDATLISATLMDETGQATDHYTPGTPLSMHIVFETTGMPGMSIDVTLRDQHNLPVGYYASGSFSSIPLPTVAGRYECTLSLDRLMLAAGEYNIDLHTASTAIIIDHKVDGAIQFVVTACNPGDIGYDFRQDEGVGHLALRLTAPLEFKRVSGGELPDLQSDARLGWP
jgi:lipopolysaccharide transport system ATP-binding protein